MLSIFTALFFACGEKPANTDGASATTSETATKTTPAPAPATSGSSGSVSGDTVVVTWNGGELSYAQATEPVQGKLKQMLGDYLTEKYQLERQSLDQAINEKLLEAEYKKQGLTSIEELLKKEIESKVAQPSDKEIEEFYEQVKSRLRGMSLEEAKPMIIQQLSGSQQQELFQVYIADLQKAYGVKVSLPFPEIPRADVSADDDPFMGPADAPITIIQFAEYQCPYCGKAGESVKQVMEEYEGKVKMVFRDFPLSFHDRAVPAAVAANCAGEQGKYFEMHDQMMANQRSLTEEDLTKYATNISLDLDKWKTCRKDPKHEAEVKKDMADGAAVGVSGTPAFFINGIMLSGALPFSQFKEIIDRELDKG